MLPIIYDNFSFISSKNGKKIEKITIIYLIGGNKDFFGL
jgi:hypothetical protein